MTDEPVEATKPQTEAYVDLCSEDVAFTHDDGCVVNYSYINGSIHVSGIDNPLDHPKDGTTFFDKVHDDSWHRS